MKRPTAKEEREVLKVIFEEAPHLSAVEAINFLDTVYAIARRLHRLYEKACNEPLTSRPTAGRDVRSRG